MSNPLRRTTHVYKKRKSSALSTKAIYTKTGAKSQADQISALSKQIASVARKQTGLKHWGQWKKELNVQASTTTLTKGASLNLVSERFNIFPLLVPTSLGGSLQGTMEKTFQATSDQNNSNQLTLTSMMVNSYFSVKNSVEPQPPCPVSYMIVACKRGMGAEFAGQLSLETSQYGGVPAGGFNDDERIRGKYFDATAINPPTVAVTGDAEFAMMMANPGVFRILKQSHFMIGNIVNNTLIPEDNQAISNLGDSVRQIRYSCKLNQRLKSGEGTWKDIAVDDIMPDEQMYIVVHYGKSLVAPAGIQFCSQILFNGFTAN